MIPAPFRYTRAATVDEAMQVLKQDSDAKVLAGGHSLLPMMKLRLARPSHLVDVTRISELSTLKMSSDVVVVGAAVRYAVLGQSRIAEVMPLLTEAVRLIADPQVRHRGTVGGSAAHADPASDLAAVFLATDALFVVASPRGIRRIPAAEWYVAPMVTALAADEMLVRVEFPQPQPARQTYLKFPHPASGYALAGVAAMLDIHDGMIQQVRLAVTGAGAMPFRARSAEQLLAGRPLAAVRFEEAADAGAKDGEYLSDAQYSEEYRRNLACVMMRRALEKLAAE